MLKHPYTNQLVHEKSPYLLQHAHNPVNWNPWGEEPFKIAREAKGISQIKAAVLAEVALPTLARLESASTFSDYAKMRLSTINKLARSLDLPEIQIWLGDKMRLT